MGELGILLSIFTDLYFGKSIFYKFILTLTDLYEKNLFHVFCFSVPTVQVEALVGQSCKLPCQMNSTRSSDVFLVLWYVDLDGKPIYR